MHLHFHDFLFFTSKESDLVNGLIPTYGGVYVKANRIGHAEYFAAFLLFGLPFGVRHFSMNGGEWGWLGQVEVTTEDANTRH